MDGASASSAADAVHSSGRSVTFDPRPAIHVNDPDAVTRQVWEATHPGLGPSEWAVRGTGEGGTP